MKDKHMPAHLGTSPQEYAHLGLKQGQIEQWEDGMRTDGSPNTYEWWYFDAHLDDGSTVVITFFTKPIFDVKKPLSPQITFNLDRQQDIVRQKFVDTLPGIKAWAARLAGMDGAYLRFTGEVKIERYDEKMVESQQDEAIWELMYFGHVH